MLLWIIFLCSPTVFCISIPEEKTSTTYSAMQADLPHIRCSVCHYMMQSLFAQVDELRDVNITAEHGEMSEDDVYAVLDKACSPYSIGSEWMHYIDYKVVNDRVKVFDLSDSDGMVRKYCKAKNKFATILRGCNQIKINLENEIVEELYSSEAGQWKGPLRAVCYEVTDHICGRKTKLPKKRRIGREKCEPLTSEEFEALQYERFKDKANMKDVSSHFYHDTMGFVPVGEHDDL